jgi:hypothetical protein
MAEGYVPACSPTQGEGADERETSEEGTKEEVVVVTAGTEEERVADRGLVASAERGRGDIEDEDEEADEEEEEANESSSMFSVGFRGVSERRRGLALVFGGFVLSDRFFIVRKGAKYFCGEKYWEVRESKADWANMAVVDELSDESPPEEEGLRDDEGFLTTMVSISFLAARERVWPVAAAPSIIISQKMMM